MRASRFVVWLAVPLAVVALAVARRPQPVGSDQPASPPNTVVSGEPVEAGLRFVSASAARYEISAGLGDLQLDGVTVVRRKDTAEPMIRSITPANPLGGALEIVALRVTPLTPVAPALPRPLLVTRDTAQRYALTLTVRARTPGSWSATGLTIRYSVNGRRYRVDMPHTIMICVDPDRTSEC